MNLTVDMKGIPPKIAVQQATSVYDDQFFPCSKSFSINKASHKILSMIFFYLEWCLYPKCSDVTHFLDGFQLSFLSDVLLL